MKKLMSVVLVLVVLCTSFISACAEDNLTIEEMQELIYDVVGYKPYYIVEDCGAGCEEWTFIMHGGVIGTYNEGEDIQDFIKLAALYQYDWYEEMPEKVELVVGSTDLRVDGVYFEVNEIETTDDALVIDWMAWSQKIEEFEKTENGYIFSRNELAKLVYADEMASIRYWAELLEEAMN